MQYNTFFERVMRLKIAWPKQHILSRVRLVFHLENLKHFALNVSLALEEIRLCNFCGVRPQRRAAATNKTDSTARNADWSVNPVPCVAKALSRHPREADNN